MSFLTVRGIVLAVCLFFASCASGSAPVNRPVDEQSNATNPRAASDDTFAPAALTLSAGPTTVADGQPAGLFDKGDWIAELDLGYTMPIRYRPFVRKRGRPVGERVDDVSSLTLAVDYYIWDGFSIGAQASGLYIDQDQDNAGAGSLSLRARWHFLRGENDKWSIYTDAQGGRMWLSTASPPTGTTYNWIGSCGLGGTYRIDDRWNVAGGVRYYHYSNGNEHGVEKNPAFDGVTFYAGVMYSF